MKRLVELTSITIFSIYSIYACTATGSITPNPTATPTSSTSVAPTASASVTPMPSSSVTPMPSPTSSSSNQYDYLIEKARNLSDISSCLAKAQNPNEEITASVEVTGICFNKGFTKKVTFTAKPKCAEGQICPQYLKEVATVEFDCEDNVTKTQCFNQ